MTMRVDRTKEINLLLSYIKWKKLKITWNTFIHFLIRKFGKKKKKKKKKIFYYKKKNFFYKILVKN